MEDYEIRPERRAKASLTKTVIICIVFGLLAFIFALCSELVLCIRNTLSGSALSGVVSKTNPADMELGMFLGEEEIAEIAENWYLPKDKVSEDSTISDTICVSAEQYGLSIDSSDLEDMLDESEIMPAIGSLVGTYEHYFLTGEDEELFNRKDLFSEIKKHKSEIKKYTGVDISDYYDDIEETLRENSKDLEKLNPSELSNDAGKYTSMALSLPAIIVLIVLSAGMAALAWLITKHPIACMRMYGIVLTVVGALAVVAAFLLPTVLKSVLTMLRSGAVEYIAEILNDSIVPVFLMIGAIYAGAGIVLIIASVVIAVVLKKIAFKKTEPAANV